MLALAEPPQPQSNLIPGLKYSPQWHHHQEEQEQAWLDQWIRAKRTPEYPWARPDHDVMADFAAFVRSQGGPR
jgi:hypothetical protein